MEWYEKKTGFHRDPKCRTLRALLKNPLAECYVDRIYCYCYEQETDHFSGATAIGTLEDAAEWRGRGCRTGGLVSALLECGFLDRDGADLVVHGVAARLAKMRAFRQRAAERKERWEHKHSEDRGGEPPKPPVQNGAGTEFGTAFQTRSEQGYLPTDLPTNQGSAAAPSPDGTLVAEFNTAVCERLARTGPYPGDNGTVSALASEVRRLGFAHAVAETTSIAKERAAQGRPPKTLAWFVSVLKSLSPPGASAGGKPRVTAPASGPDSFKKGGRCVL